MCEGIRHLASLARLRSRWNRVPCRNIFGSVGAQTTDGTSSYNALQLSINKTLSHGLGMLANFTWSHAVDDGSGFEDSGFQTRR
jgi:hypothetical protein